MKSCRTTMCITGNDRHNYRAGLAVSPLTPARILDLNSAGHNYLLDPSL